jgi:phage/plasmid primase-like uncharacterized protein
MATKRKTENDIGLSAAASAAPARRITVSKPRTKPATRPDATDVSDALPNAANAALVSEPSHQAIAQLAYSFWEARGYQGGSQEDDWLRAEQQLRLGLAS